MKQGNIKDACTKCKIHHCEKAELNNKCLRLENQKTLHFTDSTLIIQYENPP